MIGVLAMVLGGFLWLRTRSRLEADPHEFGEDSIRSQATEERICPATNESVSPDSPIPPCVGDDGSCSHWRARGLDVQCVRADCGSRRAREAERLVA